MAAPAPFDLGPAAWATLRTLLDELLALPDAARSAWIDHLDAAHEALKPILRRLAEHADDASATDARLNRLPRLPDTGPAAAAGASPQDMPSAGPYQAVRLLGEGGMCSVWLAERNDMLLQRPVALKLPRATWRQPELAARMAREREILAALDHPHIARILDAGVTVDGQPWLALEYAEGRHIDQHCRDQGLDVRQRIALFLQVVDAVAHAHAKLVVHRDLKPANILVTPAGEVRLLDFGIAKLLGDASAGMPELTLAAGRAMTPGYAAPEQIRGEAIGTATDIHALGVVLCELLCGQRPFRPARDSAAALEEAILHADPLPPSVLADDGKIRRELRGGLDTIVAKALRKDPAQRYRSATALADDLEAWLQHRPVRARPDNARYRTLKYLRRHRVGIAVVGVIVLALGAGLAAALWQAGRARAEAARALAIKDYLVGLFAANDIEQRDARRMREQSVQQLLEQSADTLSTALPDAPEVRDELQHVVGRLLADLEIGGPAVHLRRERVAQLQALGADAATRADALRELAASERALGEMPSARSSANAALALCASAGIVGAPPCRAAAIERGRIDFAEQHLEAALANVEPATAALRRDAPNSIELADAIDLLGLLRAAQNRGDEAIALYEESLAIRRAAWGAESVRLAIARFNFGRDLWALRHFARAEGELREAYRVVAAALGPEHPRAARIELNLGRLTCYLGLRDDGLAHLRHASAIIFAAAPGLDPHAVLDARVALGNALLLDGHLGEAGPELERALALRADLGKAAMADPTLDQSWARYLLDLGRYGQAREWLEQVRARTIATYGPGHPEVGERNLRIAMTNLAEGRLDAAGREIDAVFASQDANEAQFGSVKHKAVLARAALWLAQGRADEAQPLIDPLLAAMQRTPREDQYRETLYQLHDVAARIAAQRGRHDMARPHFEAAIALLERARVDTHHPYLAATRARYAASLLAQGDIAGARRQAGLARAAFAAMPTVGDHFRRALRDVERQLASGAATTARRDRPVAIVSGFSPWIPFSQGTAAPGDAAAPTPGATP